jgi:hypothetical protein
VTPNVVKYNELMPRLEMYLQQKGLPLKNEGDERGVMDRESVRRHFGTVLLKGGGGSSFAEEEILSEIQELDPVMAEKIMEKIYARPSFTPTLFRVFEPGSQVMIDLEARMETHHSGDGDADFEPGERIVMEGDLVSGIFVVTGAANARGPRGPPHTPFRTPGTLSGLTKTH